MPPGPAVAVLVEAQLDAPGVDVLALAADASALQVVLFRLCFVSYLQVPPVAFLDISLEASSVFLPICMRAGVTSLFFSAGFLRCGHAA